MIIQDKTLLKEPCLAVVDNGLEIAAQLIIELEKHPTGIGLSAPQIGIQERVFVFQKSSGLIAFAINPIIVEKRYPYLNHEESCLSFPDKFVNTIRYRQVIWKDDFKKEPVEMFGRDALVWAHEFDHLDGILMFDRTEPGKYDKCFCGSEEKYKFCC